jgi:hypothetical protein
MCVLESRLSKTVSSFSMKMRVGQILVLLRWNALSHVKKHMSAWKSVSFVNKCFLSIHHSQEIYRTKATQRTKKMSNTDSIKKHRCTNILENGNKFLFV